MGMRGYFPSFHADVEQGTPGIKVEGELTQEGEELNRHGGRMAKAMNIDSRIGESHRERERAKSPSDQDKQ